MTQLEPARPHTTRSGTSYADYAPRAPDFYMQRTKEWVTRARAARGCERDDQRSAPGPALDGRSGSREEL